MAPSGLRSRTTRHCSSWSAWPTGRNTGTPWPKDTEDFAGVRLGPGALYRAIARLVERGLIEPAGDDDRRRPYRITPPGSAGLAAALADMRRVTSTGLARLGLDPA